MKPFKKILAPHKHLLKNANYKQLESADGWLIKKWGKHIPKGWYGFDGINELWGRIIDDFLEELVKDFPNLEIHQIKLKFGGLRFYVGLNDFSDSKKCAIANHNIDKLEDALFSETLIY